VAHLAALLHDDLGGMAEAATPLDFVTSRGDLRSAMVLFISAGGRNPDILRAFRTAAHSEPRGLMALCLRSGSPLEASAEEFEFARVLSCDLPSGRDGFLATNSLMAAASILARAYTVAKDADAAPVPLAPLESLHSATDKIRLSRLTDCSTWVVLHGRWGKPAAVDIESKSVEAALQNVQVADYRNFGHGRHHWLAKRAQETAVIALATPEDHDLPSRTLDALPSDIRRCLLTTPNAGVGGTMELFVNAMALIAELGTARGIDPGKPGVPAFGRRIYHLGLPTSSRDYTRGPFRPTLEKAAVYRKLRVRDPRLPTAALPELTKAYMTYTRVLQSAVFGALVLDYDGTLCAPDARYGGVDAAISATLSEILECGGLIGVATGRGRSVRVALQECLPRDHWENVLVGYYNGADIALLSDDARPHREPATCHQLENMCDCLLRYAPSVLTDQLVCRPKQVSLTVPNERARGLLQTAICHAIDASHAHGVQVMESSHSLDVLAPGVSKAAVVHACQEAAIVRGLPGTVLRIGDKGRWPGNDCHLLTGPYSLSVDEVSPDIQSCWNLAPPGHRGVQATRGYLSAISVAEGLMRFRLSKRGAADAGRAR
jgi:hypothetical protein